MSAHSLASSPVYIPPAPSKRIDWAGKLADTIRALTIFAGVGIFIACATLVLAPVS